MFRKTTIKGAASNIVTTALQETITQVQYLCCSGSLTTRGRQSRAVFQECTV